ncbi:MAG: oxygenase MpaB family protein, partial [Nannocystaceae bacterium]
NQADLLYTLMSFSQVVLDGLRTLRLDVSREEGEAYLSAWRTVGRLMGIKPEVLPNNLEEAAALTKIMAKREHGASHEGKAMTEALAGLIGDVLGGPLSMFRWSLIRLFVRPAVCRMLGVPRHPVLDRLAHSVAGLALLLDHAVDRPGPVRRWFRRFSVHMIQFFIEEELGPTSRNFRIPEQLHRDWEIPGTPNPNFVVRRCPVEAE